MRPKALERIFEADFDFFRGTVLGHFSPEDRNPYDRAETWDDIKRRVAEFIEGLEEGDAEK